MMNKDEANNERRRAFVYPISMKFGMGANNGQKRQNEFEMPTTIFRPTSPTNQNRPQVKISNFCVFCPIWMKFGMGAKNGTKTR